MTDQTIEQQIEELNVSDYVTISNVFDDPDVNLYRIINIVTNGEGDLVYYSESMGIFNTDPEFFVSKFTQYVEDWGEQTFFGKLLAEATYRSYADYVHFIINQLLYFEAASALNLIIDALREEADYELAEHLGQYL